MILVINAGSSSIKYQLIDIESQRVTAKGTVERVGEGTSHIRHDVDGSVTEGAVVAPDHSSAFRAIAAMFDHAGPDLKRSGIAAVAHRVVMGGPDASEPVVITEDVVARIERLSPLAPLHNPANLAAILAALDTLPHVPHVAVFDTAYFHDLPLVASTYAIDRKVSAAHSIRRYGFHGISHEYVSGVVGDWLGKVSPSPRPLRQIVLHLGNGASASAVVDGRAIDTSMGFTPLEGLVMGTRSGDIDPSVAFYLHREHGMTIADIDRMLNHSSGLKGLSGHNDMRDVHRLIASGDGAARLALDIYVRRLQKYIGAYAAVMGGLDALTFTAGVGENDAVVRAETIAPLGFLGIVLDPDRNDAAASDDSVGVPRVISSDDSDVRVLVVPTREELSMARQAAAILR
ncbi:MAG: acetate kinase [Microthrixaceae bacterium]